MFSALHLIVAAIAAWLTIGALALLSVRDSARIIRLLFIVGTGVGLLLAVVAFTAMGQIAQSIVLPLGLPDLPFHLRLDSLSAFFLLLLGVTAAGISLFSAGYFRDSEGSAPGLLCLQYHTFLAAMALVLIADDAYVFMVAWESMALSSYFLVTTDHRIAEVRRAGFLYLLIAHIGAIAILLCFGVLQGGSGDYSFGSMRSVILPGAWGSIAFLLALFGFGAKAGLLPLHIWLPEAHPAAPSPVSALMSGVMLKTAIYGLLRVTFDLLNGQLWWWGVVALVLGLVSALFGVIFATVQTDMKRLLAYSSIENIGIIVAGIGLSILFKSYDKTLLAALTLTATLYHALNHAVFKSLLFLATGSVLHATKERSLGRLGGLIHRMPWVAWLALVGTLAMAGLPPLNGFVSEWLLLQAFLFTPSLPQSFINMLVPLAAAALVLAVALAAYVMVKFYGVVFLGRPREPNLAYAKDPGWLERAALVWFALGCVVLGLFPVNVIALIDPVDAMLVGSTVGGRGGSWMLLAPVNADRSSYSPIIFLAVIAAVVMLTIQVVHRQYHGRIRKGPAWDCGFPLQTPRMQDTAEGFGQPIRQVFEPFFRIERTLPSPFDARPQYKVVLEDHFWHWLYLPVARAADAVARLIGRIQQGRISIYLTYSFFTLLALLFFVR
ncbi:MAG: hydrogenase 4 subunit B [Betaproteobacteria bacterium 13_1_20CM_3_63_8]|nr:MAG: hydrogenase 4 subunit B [Betaproteobacteria bacterium 13_1_20CM_3_63_8]